MREIIFRGKEKYIHKSEKGTEKWVYGNLIYTGDYCCILQNEKDLHPMDEPFLVPTTGVIDGIATPVIPETIGQYTGLTDKNGKKIFEGDIIKTYGGFIGGDGIFAVNFDEGGFGTDNNFLQAWLCWGEFKGEIIGNIFDNPELLI